MSPAPATHPASAQQRRAFWLKHLHQWHWVSAAACLVGMILFSLTGFTLNHASWISAKPAVKVATAQLPAELLQRLHDSGGTQVGSAAGNARELPLDVARWLARNLSVRAQPGKTEWSDDEIYLSLPRPGGDAWLTIDLAEGRITHEVTDRGFISYLNDLHKGRNTGAAWSLFIDVFAGAALIFAVTGLFLLKLHAAQRSATWPMVGLGLALPLLLAILFIH